jgi:aconitase A
LTFVDPADCDRFGQNDRVSVAARWPRKPATLRIKEADGRVEEVQATLTDEQIAWFKAGSALKAAQKY